jgi:hypothetical protein
MCTVLVRFRPGAPWPLLVAAVRDEFLDRPWDPPAAHWPDRPSLVGGRDRVAGGTWLAVDSTGASMAAILNGTPLPGSAPRPSRGELPLAALDGTLPASFEGYDTFHLVVGTPSTVEVSSWDGTTLVRTVLPPGDHIIVNAGVDTPVDPLVPHFLPLFAATPEPPLTGVATSTAWGPWVSLLLGDGLAPDDPRALLISLEREGIRYGSGSLALVAIAPSRVRYDFSATPFTPTWSPILNTFPPRSR